jgi:pimeloyl-ACP methyl ester carboxylesterase
LINQNTLLFQTTLKSTDKGCIAGKDQRNGALAFARSLLNDQDWFEELWSKRQAISNKQTLFIWGMKDPAIKPHFLDKFQGEFKNSAELRLETCGHFPQEEQSEEVIAAIMNFVKDNTNNR